SHYASLFYLSEPSAVPGIYFICTYVSVYNCEQTYNRQTNITDQNSSQSSVDHLENNKCTSFKEMSVVYLPKAADKETYNCSNACTFLCWHKFNSSFRIY